MDKFTFHLRWFQFLDGLSDNELGEVLRGIQIFLLEEDPIELSAPAKRALTAIIADIQKRKKLTEITKSYREKKVQETAHHSDITVISQRYHSDITVIEGENMQNSQIFTGKEDSENAENRENRKDLTQVQQEFALFPAESEENEEDEKKEKGERKGERKEERKEAKERITKEREKERGEKKKEHTPNAGMRASNFFQKPTLDEIITYVQLKGYSAEEINAEYFYDFYQSKGWKVGNAPMKDWKAAVRNWVRTSRERRYAWISYNDNNHKVFHSDTSGQYRGENIGDELSGL